MHDSQPDLRHYLRLLQRNLWLVALVAALAIAAAAIASTLRTPVYESAMKIVVGQRGGVFQPQFGSAVDPFTQTMTNLLESDVVARDTIQRLGLDMRPKDLLHDLHVSSNPQSSVLDVRYRSTSKAESVRVLDAIGSTFTGLVARRLDHDTDTGAITATVFDDAHFEQQVVPRLARTVGIAALVGIVLGILAALTRGSLDRRLYSRRAAEEAFAAPVLGTLPKLPRRTLTRRVAHVDSFVDALHLLRLNMEFSDAVGGPTFLVTSALPEEGKSTVVSNLGVALAAVGKNVVCVEADLRRPKLARYLSLGASTNAGFAEVIEGRTPLHRALVDVPLAALYRRDVVAVAGIRRGQNTTRTGGRLRVLLSGTPAEDPTNLLAPDRLGEFMHSLAALRVDHVIFDAPPLLLVADAFPLARAVDSVLVVARGGRTTRESAEAVRTSLGQLGVDRFGVVLTEVDPADRYGYGYGTGYGYSQTHERPHLDVVSEPRETGAGAEG